MILNNFNNSLGISRENCAAKVAILIKAHRDRIKDPLILITLLVCRYCPLNIRLNHPVHIFIKAPPLISFSRRDLYKRGWNINIYYVWSFSESAYYSLIAAKRVMMDIFRVYFRRFEN